MLLNIGVFRSLARMNSIAASEKYSFGASAASPVRHAANIRCGDAGAVTTIIAIAVASTARRSQPRSIHA